MLPNASPLRLLHPGFGQVLRGLRRSIFGEKQEQLSHLSTYLVLGQDIFFPEIFFGLAPSLRSQFRFLTTPSCLADLVASGRTDINLADGRLWNMVGFREEPRYDHNLRWQEARTEEHLRIWGHSIDSLFDKALPNRNKIQAAFVPNLGELSLCRNALPNISRSSTYSFVSEILRPETYSAYFGIVDGGDQSLSHVPISLKSPPRIRIEGGKNISVGGRIFTVQPKLRIHIYPYGLCAIYLIFSIASSGPYSTRELLHLARLLLSDRPGRKKERIELRIKSRTFSVPGVYAWVFRNLTKALLISNEAQPVSFNRRYAICANTKNAPAEAFDSTGRELLGLLTLNLNYGEFSYPFLRQYPSLFGKYAGEYVLSASENMILSFGPILRNYSKRKTRSRFYWGLLNVYRFALAQKNLAFTFRRMLANKSNDRNSLATDFARARIDAWLHATEHHYRLLSPFHRRLYYRLIESLGTEKATLSLKDYLDGIAHPLQEKEVADGIRRTLAIELLDMRRGISSELQAINTTTTSTAGRIQRLEELHLATEEKLESTHERIQELTHLTRADQENYQESLENLLGSWWHRLSEDTQWLLITAEYLYATLPDDKDFSAAMIEYCKALESELNICAVVPLVAYISEHVPKGYIAAGSRKLGPEHQQSLTLGSFPYLISPAWTSEVTGRQYTNRSYDEEFSDFLESRSRGIYKYSERRRNSVASAIQAVADYRNKAAHVDITTKAEVEVVRSAWEEEVGGVSWALDLFN